MALAATGFVTGVDRLHDAPEIPPYFSPLTVERVQAIGGAVGQNGVTAVSIRRLDAAGQVGVVDIETVDHARRAITVSRRAFGSVQGRLEVLRRSASGPRAQIMNEKSRRAVTVRASPDQTDVLREAWGRRVVAAGELMRNALGQAVKLELTELIMLPELEPANAWALLGIDRDATGSLSTEEFIRQVRRG